MNRTRRADVGMTLVEMLVVVALLGLVMTVISAAFVTILRVSPSTEYRIDDARSTRGLQTWLVRDVASTPPEIYNPATGVGFVDSSFALPTDAGVPISDLCPTATGIHVLFMAWVDGGVSYRAQYTIEGDPGSGYEVVRTVCGGDIASISLTGEVSVDPCLTPVGRSRFTPADDLVELCFLSVQGDGGLSAGGDQQPITMSVVSRNGDMP